MNIRKAIHSVIPLCLILTLGGVTLGQGKNIKEGASQANNAATVFREIMSAPDKTIPSLTKAI